MVANEGAVSQLKGAGGGGGYFIPFLPFTSLMQLISLVGSLSGEPINSQAAARFFLLEGGRCAGGVPFYFTCRIGLFGRIVLKAAPGSLSL